MSDSLNKSPPHANSIRVVIYENMDETIGQLVEHSLDELSSVCTVRQIRAQKDGKLISFAHAEGESFQRRETEVTAISGLVVDVDNEMVVAGQKMTQIADFEIALQGYAYGIYTTHNHRLERPRFRLILPLSRALLPLEFERAHTGLVALLGNDPNINSTCGELRGRYPLPSCPDERQYEAFQRWTSGKLIEPEILLTASGENKSRASHFVTTADGKQRHLRKLASALISRGESREAVIHALVCEDDKFTQPVFSNRREGWIAENWAEASTAEEEIREAINQIRTAENEVPLRGDAKTASAALSDLDLRDFENMDIPPPKFAIESFVPCGQVSLLGAHGGAGKSVLALTLAAHFASYRDWAGLKVTGGNVLVVSLEDPPEIVLGRLKRITKEYGLDAASLMRRLKIVDGSSTDGVLFTESAAAGSRQVMSTDLMKQVRKYASQADLIVVDTASDAFDGDENNRRVVRSFIRGLAQLARASNAGLILIAHIDKYAARTDANKNSYSGSTAWHNSSRSRFTLKQDGENVLLQQEKSNYKKLAEPISLRWTNDGILVPFVADSKQVLADLAADAEAILLAIYAAIKLGQDVPIGRKGSYTTQKALADHVELPGHLGSPSGRSKFWRAINHLLATNQIESEEYRSPQRKKLFRYVPTAAARALPPIPPTH